MSGLPKDVPLFRHEVLLHRTGSRFGEVLFTKPRWLVRTGVCAVVMTFVGGALVLSGSYTQRSQARGWVTLLPGQASITAPRSGTIKEFSIRDGSHVSKGQILLSIDSERYSTTGENVEKSVVEQLRRERSEVARQLDLESNISVRSGAKLSQDIGSLKSEIAQLRNLQGLSKQRLSLALADLSRTEGIVAGKYLPKKALDDANNVVLNARIELSQSEQKLEEKRTQLASTDQLRMDQPVALAKARAAIRERLAAIDQRIIEAASAGTLLIASPVDGVVSGASTLAVGSSIAAGNLLLTVIPDGATFRGEMFVPSSNAGFLKPGMEVWLRYDAFPFARFGQYRAKLASVDRTVLTPNMQAGPVTLNEPAYRAVLLLDSQHVRAYGEDVGLQSGLMFSAAVSLGSRRVIDIVLDPLFATGRNIY